MFVEELQGRIDKLISVEIYNNEASLIDKLLSKKATCSLHLSDAVAVLRNFTQSSNASENKALYEIRPVIHKSKSTESTSGCPTKGRCQLLVKRAVSSLEKLR